jgi:hypothetical protein
MRFVLATAFCTYHVNGIYDRVLKQDVGGVNKHKKLGTWLNAKEMQTGT